MDELLFSLAPVTMEITTTDTPAFRCQCGELLDATSGKYGRKPEPGSITLCAYCGTLYRFEDDMRTVSIGIEDLPNDPAFRKCIRTIQKEIQDHWQESNPRVNMPS
jgi:hypothetical protein